MYADLLDEVENGRVKDIQAEINRLLTAGKDSIKSKITEAVKEEYLPEATGTGRSWRRNCWLLRTQTGTHCTRKRTLCSG